MLLGDRNLGAFPAISDLSQAREDDLAEPSLKGVEGERAVQTILDTPLVEVERCFGQRPPLAFGDV